MIANPKNEGWEIFSHSSHGLLAGKIAHEMADKYKNKDWVATLAAIIEHDDRQLNFNEKDYLTEMGTPKDFQLEKRKASEIVKRSKRLMAQADEKSCLIAALIAHHLQFIYAEMAPENKKISEFLKELKEREKKYINNLKYTKKQIDRIYQVMVFADRCSLILCEDQIPAKNREIEINTSIDGETYWLNKKQSGEIQIRPWIFSKKSFSLTAEYKLLPQSSFKNNREFEEVLARSPVKIKTWNVCE